MKRKFTPEDPLITEQINNIIKYLTEENEFMPIRDMIYLISSIKNDNLLSQDGRIINTIEPLAEYLYYHNQDNILQQSNLNHQIISDLERVLEYMTTDLGNTYLTPARNQNPVAPDIYQERHDSNNYFAYNIQMQPTYLADDFNENATQIFLTPARNQNPVAPDIYQERHDSNNYFAYYIQMQPTYLADDFNENTTQIFLTPEHNENPVAPDIYQERHDSNNHFAYNITSQMQPAYLADDFNENTTQIFLAPEHNENPVAPDIYQERHDSNNHFAYNITSQEQPVYLDALLNENQNQIFLTPARNQNPVAPDIYEERNVVRQNIYSVNISLFDNSTDLESSIDSEHDDLDKDNKDSSNDDSAFYANFVENSPLYNQSEPLNSEDGSNVITGAFRSFISYDQSF